MGKKWFLMAFVSVALLGAMPSTGSANGGHGRHRIGQHHRIRVDHGPKKFGGHWKKWEKNKGRPATGVPELDPNAAGQALALLLAGTGLLIDRRRAALRA